LKKSRLSWQQTNAPNDHHHNEDLFGCHDCHPQDDIHNHHHKRSAWMMFSPPMKAAQAAATPPSTASAATTTTASASVAFPTKRRTTHKTGNDQWLSLHQHSCANSLTTDATEDDCDDASAATMVHRNTTHTQSASTNANASSGTSDAATFNDTKNMLWNMVDQDQQPGCGFWRFWTMTERMQAASANTSSTNVVNVVKPVVDYEHECSIVNTQLLQCSSGDNESHQLS
jgi:hypothetical protein